MSQVFYNTIQLTGNDLKNAIQRAKSLDQSILLLFKNTQRDWSPSQIFHLFQKADKQFPITSIRRSLNTLTNAGDLVKTENQVNGMYDLPEHQWSLNRRKHSSNPIAEQQKIF